jgi:hypothetical protein
LKLSRTTETISFHHQQIIKSTIRLDRCKLWSTIVTFANVVFLRETKPHTIRRETTRWACIARNTYRIKANSKNSGIPGYLDDENSHGNEKIAAAVSPGAHHLTCTSILSRSSTSASSMVTCSSILSPSNHNETSFSVGIPLCAARNPVTNVSTVVPRRTVSFTSS